MIVPVIMCGGSGSRLWPVSREQHPKQFIKLADEQTLLQKTFTRSTTNPLVTDIIVITHERLFFTTQRQLKEIAKPGQKIHYLLEPVSRNTAAAVAIVAAYCKKHFDENITLLILPADHLITDSAALANGIAVAESLAKQNYIVTFGIKPTHPECGYGYIEKETMPLTQDEPSPAFLAKRFVEKPSLEYAIEYIKTEKFVWNSGMFCLNVATAYQAFNQHAAHFLPIAENCLTNSSSAESVVHLPAEIFSTMDSLSFDYAIMERFNPVAIVECNMGWCDIGSWDTMAKLLQPDEQGNRVQGNVFLQDTKHCYVRSDGRFVGLIGLEKLVIVDTHDALLISHVDDVQNVKNIVSHLKENKSPIAHEHTTVYRPWGNYTVLEESPSFKIKRIIVHPSATLSLQMHHHRNEHWVVIEGTARVTNNEQILILQKNESTYIPMGNKHRLENIGEELLVIIEVQTGTYLGEDDIVRFDDIYGRSLKLHSNA